MVEQIFLPVGEILFMHNVDTQFTTWRGVRSKGRDFFFLFIFIFSCPGSLLPHVGYSLVVVSGIYSSLHCSGFLLGWLLLLQSWGCRHLGLAIPGLAESSWTTDWMNLCPLHWQVDSYPLYHQKSPREEFLCLNFSCLAINVNFILQKQASKVDCEIPFEWNYRGIQTKL